MGLGLTGALVVLLSPKARAGDKLPPLRLELDKDKVDLAAGQLEVRLSRAAARVTLKVVGESGAVVAEVEQVFSGVSAGAPLVVHWKVVANDPVARIEVYGYDIQGYFKGVAITPWSSEVPHQEVVFETDSAAIRGGEESKLKDSRTSLGALLAKYRALGALTLYIVAHTDTVGSRAYNRKLSRRRAQAIASWFRSHGLNIPIAYDGLGESALKIKTADEVAEARNRRVDYFLALTPPRFKKSGAAPQWRKA